MAGEIAPRPPGAASHAIAFGQTPIGTIISWTSHLTGTPKLPQEYVQCLGQVITDTASPMKGQTVPNLSGAGGTNFLSGATVSGQTGGSGTINLPSSNTTFWGNSTSAVNTPVNFTIVGLGSTSVNNVAPPYYTVIYCMRIK